MGISDGDQDFGNQLLFTLAETSVTIFREVLEKINTRIRSNALSVCLNGGLMTWDIFNFTASKQRELLSAACGQFLSRFIIKKYAFNSNHQSMMLSCQPLN